MRFKRFVFPLLVIITPFVLALTFNSKGISPSQFTESKAVISEPEEKTGDINTGHKDTDREDTKNIDNIKESDENTDNIDNNKEASRGMDKTRKIDLGDDTDEETSKVKFEDFQHAKNAETENMIIKESAVIATITHDAKIYHAMKGGVMQDIHQGDKVEILQDRSWSWYEISIGDTVGWVKAEDLDIPPDPPTNPTRYSNKQLEDFINKRHFESASPYFIWVDIDRQLVHIFKGFTDEWNLIKTMICSTGKNVSPTTRGTFTISDRDTWMFSSRLGSGAKYWTRFNNSYLFHSVAYAEDGETVVDDTLGTRSSAGCIRLSLEDSKWIYDNMEQGTTVWVN